MSSPLKSRKVLRSSENVARKPAAIRQQARKKKAPKAQKPKPPQAPRSAFICFTDAKKKEIMIRHGIVEESEAILNIVATEWKSLSDKDRARWDEEARNDKVRFVQEKSAYQGSYSVPKRRAKKHPLAPKRPMSAFLKFSQTRRSMVKTDNPDMSNTDVSRLLGEMWRTSSPKEKAPYVEQEEREREVYKEAIKKFREEQARMDAASRSSHHSVQQSYHRGYHHHNHPAPPPAPPQQYLQAPLPPPTQQQQLHVPLPPPQHDRFYSSGIASSFESTMNLDHFADSANKSTSKPYPHPSQYTNPFPLYRKSQYHPQAQTPAPAPAPAPDHTLHHSFNFQEADPIPVSRPSLAPAHPQLEEDELHRSNYFADMNIDYYSRYQYPH